LQGGNEAALQGKKQKGGGKKGGGAAASGAGSRTEFVHTLNSTACAVPRIIVAILENFQQVRRGGGCQALIAKPVWCG